MSSICLALLIGVDSAPGWVPGPRLMTASSSMHRFEPFSGRIMKDLPGSEGTEATWVGVSGSWRYVLPGLRDAVHKEVAAALAAGKSIVTGGALGTDYWATEMALSIDPARLKVIVPTSLVTYAAHYRRRAAEGVISAQQAENLITNWKPYRRQAAWWSIPNARR